MIFSECPVVVAAKVVETLFLNRTDGLNKSECRSILLPFLSDVEVTVPKMVDHTERRAAIALAAAAAIAEIGLDGTTVREIARRSGFSKGIVEHYFTGKADIIAAALGQMNARYLYREKQQTAGLRGLAALRARMHCVMPLDKETRQEWKIRLAFWSVAAIDDDARKEQRLRLKLTRERFQADLEQAVELGEINRACNTAQMATKLGLFMVGSSCSALMDTRYYNKAFLIELIEDNLQQLTSGVYP